MIMKHEQGVAAAKAVRTATSCEKMSGTIGDGKGWAGGNVSLEPEIVTRGLISFIVER